MQQCNEYNFCLSWDKVLGMCCGGINLMCIYFVSMVLAAFEAMAWVCESVCTLGLVV